MKRRLALFLSICMLAAMLLGCSTTQNSTDDPQGSAGSDEKVLVVRHNTEPSSLQPNKTTNDAAYNIISNIYSRLVKLDASRQVIPDLASSIWWTTPIGMTAKKSPVRMLNTPSTISLTMKHVSEIKFSPHMWKALRRPMT